MKTLVILCLCGLLSGCSIGLGGARLSLGYETKLQTKCELVRKTDFGEKHGPEGKCGASISTTWVVLK